MHKIIICCLQHTEKLGKLLAEELNKVYRPDLVLLSHAPWDTPEIWNAGSFAKYFHILLLERKDLELPWFGFLAGLGWAKGKRLVLLTRSSELQESISMPSDIGIRLALDESGWGKALVKVISEKIFQYPRHGKVVEAMETAISTALQVTPAIPEPIPMRTIGKNIMHSNPPKSTALHQRKENENLNVPEEPPDDTSSDSIHEDVDVTVIDDSFRDSFYNSSNDSSDDSLDDSLDALATRRDLRQKQRRGRKK